MKVENMTLRDWSPTLATFSIITEEGIKIYRFKIVEGRNGLFISLPSVAGKDGKFFDIIWLKDEMKDKLTAKALDEFKHIGGKSQNLSSSDNAYDMPI
jgi:DNA-binding cell septation regulator SpoVG